MHFCFYEGNGEEWSHDLAWKLISSLEDFEEGFVSTSGDTTINETSDYLLSGYIKEQKYVVIVVSQKLFTDMYALVELDLIKKLFGRGEIVVFSIYDGKHIPVLPERAEWINDTWKIPINKPDDETLATSIILERVMKDRLIDSIAANMVENLSMGRQMLAQG
jgi:hypothetical protein